jgi:hypothetical protein
VDVPDIQQFIDLELFLLTPQARLSPATLEELLDPDFREIGASGRRWTRAETISTLSAELSGELSADLSAESSAETADDGPIEATDFEMTAVASGVVLVTFQTVGRGRRSLRSSLWRRSRGRWRVLHHQGTPTSQ